MTAIPVGTQLPEWRVTALNSATESENKIHDNAVARQYGFEGGLVPGVTIHGYMTRPVVEALGRDWLERGKFITRFVKPFYEGQEVICRAAVTRSDSVATDLDVHALNADGTVCAVGTASLPVVPPAAPALRDYPIAPLPDSRPTVSQSVLEGIDILGTVHQPAEASLAETRRFLEEIQDSHALYRGDAAVLHPGYLIRWANTLLVANVHLGAWIHVSSEVQHFSTVQPGEDFEIRGRVVDLFERKGHKFLTMDQLMVAGDRPVFHCQHTAIYDVRKVAAS